MAEANVLLTGIWCRATEDEITDAIYLGRHVKRADGTSQRLDPLPARDDQWKISRGKRAFDLEVWRGDVTVPQTLHLNWFDYDGGPDPNDWLGGFQIHMWPAWTPNGNPTVGVQTEAGLYCTLIRDVPPAEDVYWRTEPLIHLWGDGVDYRLYVVVGRRIIPLEEVDEAMQSGATARTKQDS